MSSTVQQRPLPVPDAQSAGYWNAASRHELALARCGQCHMFAHPPGAVCCACGSIEPAFEWMKLSGKGRIRSWSVVRQALLPGFADLVPYVTVDVELEEQPNLRIIGRLLDGIEAPLVPGAPVAVCFEDIAPDVAVPAFRLAAG